MDRRIGFHAYEGYCLKLKIGFVYQLLTDLDTNGAEKVQLWGKSQYFSRHPYQIHMKHLFYNSEV